MIAVTPYPELDGLLDEIVGRAREVLGDGFVGAYLQGSFAVGDADLHSDCDFLVVHRDRLTPVQESAIRELHDEIPTRAGHWTHHLEGSWLPVGDVRTLDGLGRRWLYVDPGWRAMSWSTHCNTEVARWSLRERGVVLAGPEPSTFVAPVPPEMMRVAMRESVKTLTDDIFSWAPERVAWSHRYLVTNHCRVLYSLVTGAVASKRAASLWAAEELDPRWRPLLQRVVEERARGCDPDDAPEPGQAEESRAFAAYARDWARAWRERPTA